TWKQWDMPSGPPICALRASVRRTSGNGFTGWPTPTAGNASGSQLPKDATTTGKRADGGKATVSLNMVAQVAGNATAQLAGWATPTTRDHKDGEYCPNVPTNCLLGRQAWITGAPAQTEKRGALNPALSRWLM